MAVKIRLARTGARNRPFYRIVVADTRAPRNGRFIELVGTYDPTSDPPALAMRSDRIEHWMGHGATPTRTVGELIARAKEATKVEAAES